MNPRHRRLLIPGLLITLLVVVVVAALTGRAGAAEDRPSVATACVVTDDRLDEQSGLAVSATVDDTAYMINDSGSRAEVYAIDTTTCEVVGVTRLDGVDWRDPEALALDGDGTLWIADTGDNLAQRASVALLALDEPGRGDGVVRPSTHPITHPGGPVDVEALLVDPTSTAKWVVTKGWTGGELVALPEALPTEASAVVQPTGVAMPLLVTDAAMTPDGRYAVVRTYLKAHVYDVQADFASVGELALPPQHQGETLAVEPSGDTILVGSEGTGQPLYRVSLARPEQELNPEPDPSPTAESQAAVRTDDDRAWSPWTAGALVAVVVLGAGVLVTRRRHRP